MRVNNTGLKNIYQLLREGKLGDFDGSRLVTRGARGAAQARLAKRRLARSADKAVRSKDPGSRLARDTDKAAADGTVAQVAQAAAQTGTVGTTEAAAQATNQK